GVGVGAGGVRDLLGVRTRIGSGWKELGSSGLAARAGLVRAMSTCHGDGPRGFARGSGCRGADRLRTGNERVTSEWRCAQLVRTIRGGSPGQSRGVDPVPAPARGPAEARSVVIGPVQA